ncbi:uncharacterized protein B0T15DRAFT_511205 [Chaetomium strumarium]|uniref:C2H2-type domain-containing protein n=1 Tax=Chaetomium strumarium TaxID=1170767 RepID=A0AAJ0GSF5_9PEZI|nr:hypothetical protein B0T15DRAFT_511205 [Chaetomium strumarium]
MPDQIAAHCGFQPEPVLYGFQTDLLCPEITTKRSVSIWPVCLAGPRSILTLFVKSSNLDRSPAGASSAPATTTAFTSHGLGGELKGFDFDIGRGFSGDANVASWLRSIDPADLLASLCAPLDWEEWEGAPDSEAELPFSSSDRMGSCPQMTPTLLGSSSGGSPNNQSVSWAGSSPAVARQSEGLGSGYQCADCGNVYDTRVQLSKRHKPKQPCPFAGVGCKAEFSVRAELTRHMNSGQHGGGKNVECPRCHKRFTNRIHNMRRHQKSGACKPSG